jgi:hypothetical protein
MEAELSLTEDSPPESEPNSRLECSSQTQKVLSKMEIISASKERRQETAETKASCVGPLQKAASLASVEEPPSTAKEPPPLRTNFADQENSQVVQIVERVLSEEADCAASP